MSWSNICSAVSSSSQWHALRAQRDAQGWTWETKAQESIWGSRLGCARTKGQLGNSFGRCERRRQPVYNSVREKEGERGASAQKRPTKHTMRPQWRMNYSRRLRHGLEDPFTERKWPFSPTKCFLFGLAKEAACHSGGQLKSLKSTHVRPKDARLLPGKRTRIKCVKHTLWVCHVPFKLTEFGKQSFSADLIYKSGHNFISWICIPPPPPDMKAISVPWPCALLVKLDGC